jgi:hypothetical protein
MEKQDKEKSNKLGKNILKKKKNFREKDQKTIKKFSTEFIK